MRTVSLKGKEVRMHDAVDEMLIDRWTTYNKALALDSKIGSDGNDLDHRLNRIDAYIASNDLENAGKEVNSARELLYMLVNKANPKHTSFAALVVSIDGQERSDMTDLGLKETLTMLSEAGATKGWLESILETVKKKLRQKWTHFFRTKTETD